MFWAVVITGIVILMLSRINKLPPDVERRFREAYHSIILAAHKYRIPEYVMFRIGYIESRFDPQARGEASEIGMFQITPGIVSAYYGFQPWDEDWVFITEINADIAAWLLRDEIDYWKNIDSVKAVEYAVRSYNVGRSRARTPISDPYYELFLDAAKYFPFRLEG